MSKDDLLADEVSDQASLIPNPPKDGLGDSP